jgi:signal transduction histidine kinase
LLLLLMLQRAACVMSLVASEVPYPSPVVLTVIAAWNAGLFTLAWHRGRVSESMAAIDVGLAVTLLALAAGSGQDDWAYRAALSAAAMAVAALNLMAAGVAMVLLAAAFVAETLVRKGGHVSPVSLAGDLCLLLVFAVVIGSGARSMRRHGRRAHAAVSASSDLVRDLHDTVLATLSAIASGRVDPRTEQVRSRAARDVAYLRRLLLGESSGGETPLAARLREVAGMAELLGLTVHWQGDLAPSGVPPEAVTALADATREALNNVASHAGTGECWLTLISDGGGVTIRVVDRGRGFDAASRPPGFGLRRSLTERMVACGGAVHMSSAPQMGTCVDLTWPKRST